MKKSFLASSFLATLICSQFAFAVNVHCTYEHGETVSYNEKLQRLTVVDPHTSDPKVETLIFNKIILASDGKRGEDGRLNRLQLINSSSKVILDVQRGAIENSETGELSKFKSTWDVGFGKLVGGCTQSK